MGYGTNTIIILFMITLVLNFGFDLGTNTGLQTFLDEWLQDGGSFFNSLLNSILQKDMLFGTGVFIGGSVAASLLTGGIIIHYIARGALIGALSSWFLNPVGLIQSLGFGNSMVGYAISGFILVMIAVSVTSFIGGKDL